MKVKIEVKTAEASVQTGKKSGKPYGAQQVGVYLPGSQYPAEKTAFIDLNEAGQPKTIKIGVYEADATWAGGMFEISLQVNWRSMRPLLATSQPQAKAA